MVDVRKAIDYSPGKNGHGREYTPSTTEVLMEELLGGFGAKMEQAYTNYINGSRLVRLSKPVVVAHKSTGKKRVLQAQYTKFSRLGYDRAVGIYNEAAKLDPPAEGVGNLWEAVEKRMRRGNQKFDHFKELTESQYVPDLHVHRFGKALYFALFDVDSPVSDGELKPFTVHEYGYFRGKSPAVHMEFRTEPWFVRHNFIREDIAELQDSLAISFPQTKQQHDKNIKDALALHPLDKLDRKELGTVGVPFANPATGRDFSEMYFLSPKIPRELTMAFIGRYLQNVLVG